MRKIIILLGPPGCGKGTQADLLHKQSHIPHISTGAMLRSEIEAKTPLGLEAQSYVEAGKLGPDRLIYDILFDRLSRADCKKGAILDGVPRNLKQAEELKGRFSSEDQLIVVNFTLPDGVIIDRMSGRRMCSKCGATYHVVHNPPKNEGVCDFDGAALISRKDDAPEVVADRLKVFATNTAPLIDYYKNAGVLHEILCDGKTIEAIFEELKALTK